MSAVAVSSPLEGLHGIFSTTTAGGRMPLTTSPRTRATSTAACNSTPSSPLPLTQGESIHKPRDNSPLPRSLGRSGPKFPYSPKSNIAQSRQSPKHLELGVSDWTLTGTGPCPSTASTKKFSAWSRGGKTARHRTSRSDDSRTSYWKPSTDGLPESCKRNDLCTRYNRPLKQASAQSAGFRRQIPTAPERVLDAPGLVDDYYLNLLDWGSSNQVAIGLGRNVYVWSADSGSVSCLLETPADTYVSSVKWSGDGAYVGVGLGSGEVQIWDVEEGTKLRSMHGHETRVGVMGWNKHILSTGAGSGLVLNHDVQVAQHKVAELGSHTSEVCGLEWRSDGAQLATGSDDNLLCIWDARLLKVPKFTKRNHRAAVKALSWCPWELKLLASGGGTNDGHVHFWNTMTGALVNSIDTGSQITSLKFSNHYRELVSSGGFGDNSLSIWSYPTLVRDIQIPTHGSRILHSCLSPDGKTLVTAAADESLKFWRLFDRKAGWHTGIPTARREGWV
ncbi:hypothetical protein DV735_g2567, partial [Chaetothyriales sp. CBS 134920]